MKMLVACAKADFGPRLTEAMETIRPLLKPPLVATSCSLIPWEKVLQTEGGWDAAYRWAARNHAACCLLETEAGALGRGTWQIAREFLALGKRVVVLRAGKLHRVEAVEESGAGDWRLNYGVVVLAATAREWGEGIGPPGSRAPAPTAAEVRDDEEDIDDGIGPANGPWGD